MASITNKLMESDDGDYIPPVKLKKTTNEDDHNDLYCFECHVEGDVICCDSCPCVYHPKCLGLTTLPDGDWTCPECKIVQSFQSKPFKHHSMQEFHTMLKYALRRMKSHPQAAPFMQPVDSKQMPEYLDYIIHPMDLETIEKNIDLKKYTSTDAFIADVKWITHNSVVFNGSQSKFTGIARALLKIARHEMTEIEICSECYLRSAQPVSTDWFAEPCTIPHTLCWAKMKGYQAWPAKVLRIVNDEADVRFFGQHDRAWVSINNCFVLSKEYPGVEKKKSNANFEKSLTELQTHIDRLKTLYGNFTYAPLQTPLSKTKPFKFVSIIDDSILPVYITAANSNNTLRSSIKCIKQARSPPIQQQQQSTESNLNITTATKRQNENSQTYQQQESIKRPRLSSRHTDDSGINSNRIVLRIRKTSEDLSNSRSETSNSSNNNPQLTVQIKEPLLSLREDDDDDDEDDDEDHTESQASLNVFDIFNQPSLQNKNDNEIPTKIQSPSPPPPPPPSVDNKVQNQTLLSKCVDANSTTINSDVRLSMNALLDAVDALKSISEVRTHGLLLTISNSTSSTNEAIPAQPQFAERRTTIKQPRKSRLQHRIITSQPKLIQTSNIPLPSFEHLPNEQSLSPTPANIPLRPLSISPASTDISEDIAAVTNEDLFTQQHRELERTTSIETLSVKSEPIDNEGHLKSRVVQPPPPPPLPPPPSSSSSSISTKSFLISPPANTTHHKTKTPIPANSHFSAMIPNSNTTFAPRISSTVSQKNPWPTTSSINPSIRQPLTTTHKRPSSALYPPTAQRNSNNHPPTLRMTPSSALQPQSFDSFAINPPVQRRPNGMTHSTLTSNTPPISTRNPIRMPQFNNHPIPIRPPMEDPQISGEVQMIIKNFNDKFQQLLSDFTVKIETALESNRVKYEKELEETRRSYRMSMNELRTITTQQVQEMHNSLELQYWTRLSDMRNRYESTLQQHTKSSKQLNGGPR